MQAAVPVADAGSLFRRNELPVNTGSLGLAD